MILLQGHQHKILLHFFMKATLYFVLVLLVYAMQVKAQGHDAYTKSNYISKVYVSDLGNGMYKNPILYADYSDPDVIRVRDDYYMTASSFNCTPGLPILHSRDLVNWSVINYALQKQIPEAIFDIPQHGNGVWAPAIRYHKGEFYIYYPDPDYGIYVIKSKDPAGKWSNPVLVCTGKGLIDPCPLWDDNGNTYLIHAWAASRAEINSILTIKKLSADGLTTLDDGRMVFDGHDHHPTLEGPKLYKRNGYYYIFAPAGGVSTGWQLVLRSKNIYGPYEEKIVMDQGTSNINGPHQGAWVETQTGESWFLHFQDMGPYGRITHLEPMHWLHDWPVIGIDKKGNGKGEPVIVFKKPNVGKTYKVVTPAESDEFNSDSPGLQWQWQANPKITWYAEIPGSGFLRLFAVRSPKDGKNFWSVPNLLLQKLPAPDFTATTKVRVTFASAEKQAGLIIMGSDYSYLRLQKAGDEIFVQQVMCKNAEKGNLESESPKIKVNTEWIYLRVTVSAPKAECRFSYSKDGMIFTPVGEAFFAKQDKWVGAKVGVFCIAAYEAKAGGYADFDWFKIEKNNP